ncbi:MAG: N-acetylmuramoyl-L-alanine amidase [Ignavibacteriaceae bacterium]|nr:N-acetylmuramoyl-L-alanine amidase [Ignavibacteriaceae bacterium]
MKIKNLLILLIILSVPLFSQTLSGKKFALDPGHGSPRPSSCEPETKRFETYVNHIVVPYLKGYLQSAGATIFTTRADYDSLGPCLSLSEREAVANNNNVDFFQSVHHNAFNGAANYSLVLWEQLNALSCPTGNPQWPNQADRMGGLQAAGLFSVLQTTAGYNRGDYCFLGYNLGVLNDLAMPGVLSEGSFFDNIDEAVRLANLDYLRTEAQTLFYSFLQYYNVPLPTHSTLVGVVNNTGSGRPVKGVLVSIPSLNKHYTVDSLGNGFFRFDSITPGTYSVRVTSAIDTTFTNITLTASTITKRNLTVSTADQVGDVKILSVTGSEGAINLTWVKPAGTVDSIYVYVSQNGSNWGSTHFRSFPGNATSGTVTGLTPGEPYYVRLKAMNAQGLSNLFSKGYGAIASGSGTRGLIVDGFNRFGGSGSWTSPVNNFSIFYGQAIARTNARFNTVTNSVITLASQLNAYDFIIWYLGDESTVDETFSDAEQALVKEYLRNGGKLFVTGSEIAWDLDNRGTTTDKDFFNNFLKARYVADNPTPNTAVAYGVPGNFYDGLNITFGQIYPEDYADVIDTLNGSFRVLQYNATQYAGIAFDGTFIGGSAPGKLVYLSFGVETMSNFEQRNSVITRALNFFDIPTGIEDDVITNSLVPIDFKTAVYPNPFNPSTKLQVNVPEQGYFNIVVFDILGTEIMKVLSGNLDPGIQTFDVNLNSFPSGTYIISIRSEKYSAVQKILLMK